MKRRLGADAQPSGGKARIAVAGAGWWSQACHLPQLQRNPEVEISAIIEAVEAPQSTLEPALKTRQELAQAYGVPVFSTADEFFASATASDGIIIATSHAGHFDIGIQAINAGLHVLMEKPMATDTKQARGLAVAAAKSDNIFMVNNSANFRAKAKQAHDLVRAGAVGEIKHVRCYMGSPTLWLFDDPKNVGWVTPGPGMLGNGFAWGQLSHSLAWVYLVSGLTPESVYCQMGYSEKSGADLYDSAVVRCVCGATISVEGAATLPLDSHETTGKQIDNKIFGSEGVLTYSGNDKQPSSGGLILRRHDGKHQELPGFLFEDYETEGIGTESLQCFVGGCLGRDFFNGADAAIGLKAVQTIEAMYRSAKSGRAEAVD